MKKFKKKYLTGVQAIETPQADFPDSGDFLKQGVAAAAASGNPILAGTSLLAGGVGEVVNQATLPIKRKLLSARRANASSQNAALAANRGMDVNDAVQYNRLMPGTEFIAEDGLVAPSQSLIEVERDELVFRKFGDKVKLIADFQDGKLHKHGGEDYVAEEGDIIFPKNKRGKMMRMIDKSSGFVTDKLRFNLEVSKLPKDKDVAMLGTVVGGGMNLVGQLISNIGQAADLGEGKSHRNAQIAQPLGDVLAGVGALGVGLDGLIDPSKGVVDPNAVQPTKFKKGGEVDKATPLIYGKGEKTAEPKLSIFDIEGRAKRAASYSSNAHEDIPMKKPLKYTKKGITKGSPAIYANGGTVGKDGQPIVDPVDAAIKVGEQNVFNYNNPNPTFLDPTDQNGLLTPSQSNGFRTPMSQDLVRKFGKSAQVSTANPNYQDPNKAFDPNGMMVAKQVDSYGSEAFDAGDRYQYKNTIKKTPTIPAVPVQPDGPVVAKFKTEKFGKFNAKGLANTAGADERQLPVTPTTPPVQSTATPPLVAGQQVSKDGVPVVPATSKKIKKKFNPDTAIDGAMNLASALITDEKPTAEVRNSNLLTAQHLTAIDTGDPNRQAALMSKEGARRFRRNAAGGNINQVTAAMSADDQNYIGQMSQINAGQAEKFQQVQNQNTQMDNAVNQYNTDRRNADIDINDANRAAARNIKRSSRSNYADAAQQTKVDKDVNQRDANAEAENMRANALKEGVAAAKHEEVMKALETRKQYDQGYLELMGKANPQAHVNFKQTLIDRFGLTEAQAQVYLGEEDKAGFTGAPNLSGYGLSTSQKRKLTFKKQDGSK